MSGAHTNTQQPDQDVVDLDALLGQRELRPAKVRLRGHTYMVRTDLTPAEVVQYQQWASTGTDDGTAKALRLLVGEDADRLAAVLDAMPKRHLVAVMRGFVNASGCFAGEVADDDWEDAAGEESAS